jgi:hypothetical protein
MPPSGLKTNSIPSQWNGFCAKAYTEDSQCALLLGNSGVGTQCGWF